MGGATAISGGATAVSAAQADLATALDPGEVRALAARLRAHPSFVGSPQLLRFLGYVIEETLAGRGDGLKAYTIATVALGRPADFDPANDPIVRVEATRLRQKLDAFYANEGAGEPIRIRLATGSYQALFEANASPAATAAPGGGSVSLLDTTRRSLVQPVREVSVLPAYVPWALAIIILLLLADLFAELGPMLFGAR